MYIHVCIVKCRGAYDTHNSISRCHVQQQCEDWTTPATATAAAATAAAATAAAATWGKIQMFVLTYVYVQCMLIRACSTPAHSTYETMQFS
jgi:hypothetical protein